MSSSIDVSYSFNRLTTVAATTKRNSDGTGMAAHLSGLSITALYPASAEIVTEAGLEGAAREYRQTFIKAQCHTDDGTTVTQIPDILEGDNLVVGGLEYRVRMVAPWKDVLHLIVGEQVGAS